MSKNSIVAILLVVLFVCVVSARSMPKRKFTGYKIEATADNEYTLFVNGGALLSGNKWEKKQSSIVSLKNGDVVLVQANDYDAWGAVLVEIYNDRKDFSTGVATWYCKLGRISSKTTFDQFSKWPVAVKSWYSDSYGVTKRKTSNWVWTSSQQKGYVTCATRITI